MIYFEIGEDDYIDELDFSSTDIKSYINVYQSATELPNMLYANDLITNEAITIQFDYWIKDKITHVKQFLHPPFTRRHLARVICSELKHIYNLHHPDWWVTYELHLKGVVLSNNIYIVDYDMVVI